MANIKWLIPGKYIGCFVGEGSTLIRFVDEHAEEDLDIAVPNTFNNRRIMEDVIKLLDTLELEGGEVMK